MENFTILLTRIRENDPTLTELSLRNIYLTVGLVQAFSTALKTNTVLEELNLSEALSGNGDAKLMADMLEVNKGLKVLNLEYCRIGDNGAIFLADALKKKNTTLLHLNLQNNRIGNEGAIALAGALKTNTTLTYLNLNANQFDYEGIFSIAIALSTNTTLTFLGLMYNVGVNEAGINVLISAFKANTMRIDHLIIAVDGRKEGGRVAEANMKRLSNETQKFVERNQRGHARAAQVEALFRNPPYMGLGRDAARIIAELVKESRGESKWWDPEDGGTFGVVQEAPTKRLKMGSCIQCFIQNAMFQERDTPSRVFCGRYCQKMHHSRDFPDVRGMTVEQVMKMFSLKK